MYTWNSYLTECSIFLFAKSSQLTTGSILWSGSNGSSWWTFSRSIWQKVFSVKWCWFFPQQWVRMPVSLQKWYLWVISFKNKQNFSSLMRRKWLITKFLLSMNLVLPFQRLVFCTSFYINYVFLPLLIYLFVFLVKVYELLKDNNLLSFTAGCLLLSRFSRVWLCATP